MNRKLLKKDGYPTKFGTVILMCTAHRNVCDIMNPAQYYFGEEIGKKLMEAANALNEILKIEVPKYKKHE
jgi:hypothetical protein